MPVTCSAPTARRSTPRSRRCFAGHRLGLAESCSGGLLAARITDLPGASAYLAGSVVAYSNEAKSELLGVDPRADRGPRRRLARGRRGDGDRRPRALRRRRRGVVTGIAGPDGGHEEKPVGYVCFNARLADGTAIARDPVIPGGRDGHPRALGPGRPAHAADAARRRRVADLSRCSCGAPDEAGTVVARRVAARNGAPSVGPMAKERAEEPARAPVRRSRPARRRARGPRAPGARRALGRPGAAAGAAGDAARDARLPRLLPGEGDRSDRRGRSTAIERPAPESASCPTRCRVRRRGRACSRSRPRAPGTVELQAEVAERLVAARLYEPEKRDFWPHLTVAQGAHGERRGAAQPRTVERAARGRCREALLQPVRCVRITLYRSNSRPSGRGVRPAGQLELPYRRQRRGDRRDGRSKEATEGRTAAKDAKAKDAALQAAVTQIEREFGAGSLMRLGDRRAINVEAIPTGALSLDLALGVGGVPARPHRRDLRPRVLGQDDARLPHHRRGPGARRRLRLRRRRARDRPDLRARGSASTPTSCSSPSPTTASRRSRSSTSWSARARSTSSPSTRSRR